MSSIIVKQPSETRNAKVVFSDMMEAGEVISSVSLLVSSPSTLTLVGTVRNTRIDVAVSGGYEGTSYLVTVRVLTDAGRTYEKELIVNLKDTI